MWLWIMLIAPVAAYLLLLGLIFFAQTRLLFPAASVVPAGPTPLHWQRLNLRTEAGHDLHGIHVPPSEPGSDRRLILGFGGNAWNAESAAAFLHDLYPQADVVAFHYRGYAPSEGSPSATALQADALAVHDLAKRRFREHRIVAIGFSIGSGAAAHVASHRSINGLILVTPFDSLAEVAADHYPWLPVRSLFRHQMEPARELRGSTVPVALIVAGDDRLIRPARAAALAGVVGNLVFSRTISGASHNDIYDRSDFRSIMREALERVLGEG